VEGDILGIERNFASLSVRDLLEARDLYHYHLIHKANVVGTAVGLYLIRKTDPWPSKDRPDAARKPPAVAKGERTFENSEVRDYSWPCVLAFVREWVDADRVGLSGDLHPEDMVPRTLYLPDGRMVPVCVVKVSQAEPAPGPLPRWHWPNSFIGGGFPIISETQGRKRVASVGCLVTDGHTTFALTNRHVSGPAGQLIRSVMRGTEVEVGKSSLRQLTRLPFTDVYGDFPARRTYLTLDVGLVEVTNLEDWTSQVYGLGAVGELADLSERNLSLRLIGARVAAYGAASGRLDGRIKALFYRHRSVGGFDDVSDLLIAPDVVGRGLAQTQTGDSGTIWHLVPSDESKPLRPLAIEWGAQTFLTGLEQGSFNFALATSLSNVCKLLDVELVRDHNLGARPYWGMTGHYSIGTFACDQLRTPKLSTLMKANRDRVSFPFADLDPKAIADAVREAKGAGGFVPLADVPDVVWKQTANTIPGGRDPRPRTGPEHPTHHADIDVPRPSDRKTMREVCLADPGEVSVPAFQAYYDEIGHRESRERGLLPFRIWQFFDEMVAALKKGDVARFVCAAGIASHYVGDACQPLHGSYLADGYPDGRGKDVHSAYETTMIDHQSEALFPAIREVLAGNRTEREPFEDGHAAAVATVELMDRAAQEVPPKKLVDLYIKVGPGKSRRVTDALWKRFGTETATIMADGALTLATLWESAWQAGDGNKLKQSELGPVPTDKLQELYEDPTFVESLDLDTIGPVLR